MLCRRTPFCFAFTYVRFTTNVMCQVHINEGHVFFILLLEYFQHQKGTKSVARKRNYYEHYTPCVLPKARATASYTPRNSFIRESSGSEASPRVCSGGGGSGSGGLSGTFSNPKSPTLASAALAVGPSNSGEGKYDGRTSDVTDVVTTVIVGEFRAEGDVAIGASGRTFL